MITQALRDEIEAGTLLPGTVLKQEELAARFGVSRQPIRHALERLHETGLLEKRPDRSLAVTGLRSKDVHELGQIRTSLEVTALQLSAPRLTAAALRKARRINEDLFEEEAPEILAELDQEFHATLYGACGNERLLAMIDGLRDFYKEHQQILTALEENDVQTACDVLTTHIGVTAGMLIPIDQTSKSESPV